MVCVCECACVRACVCVCVRMCGFQASEDHTCTLVLVHMYGRMYIRNYCEDKTTN